MPGYLDRVVIAAAVSEGGCEVSEVVYAVRPTVGAVVMDAVGMPLAAVTSQTRTCIRTTRVRTRRRAHMVEHMMEDILQDIVVVTVRGLMSQSRANKSWFEM
jgi:hypothetical protein